MKNVSESRESFDSSKPVGLIFRRPPNTVVTQGQVELVTSGYPRLTAMLGIDEGAINDGVRELRALIVQAQALLAHADQIAAAIPPAEVREVLDRLRDTSTSLQDAVGEFKAAATDLRAVTTQIKAAAAAILK